MKKKILLNQLKSALTDIDPGIEIILFGSRARGDHRMDSDWDILILTSQDFNAETIKEIRDRIFKTEVEMEEPITTLIYSKNEWNNLEVSPLYQIIQEDGEQA